MGREVPWNISRFQESLISACERLPPDQSCRSYSQLHSVLEVVHGPDPPSEMTWHPVSETTKYNFETLSCIESNLLILVLDCPPEFCGATCSIA